MTSSEADAYSGPEPGDSVCYRTNTTGLAWALVESISDDGNLVILSGYMGNRIGLDAERVMKWEPGPAMYYTRTGTSGRFRQWRARPDSHRRLLP